ncbi:MAG: hypothetical protein FJZ58_07955, partial [Chlamydiae bacterium]|nr:hypothetical protein [Chlamydiota bacterium]
MKQMKTKQQLSIVEAVDFLSSLAEIDITLSRKVLSSEGDTLHPHRWLDQQLLQKNQEIILEMLASIHSYLKEICEKHPDRWDDVQVCKGVQSLLFLLEEAVEKMEKFTDLFKEDPPLEGVMQLSAYQALQEYIVENVLPHLKQEEEDILGIQEEELVGVQKKGIRDLEDIKGDRFYELFYLKKEDKKPFYDYDMIRRLKLIYDFDQMREHQEEVDSFTRIRQLQNQEFSRKAAWVLQNSSHLIASFYKESMKAKSNLLVAALNKTLMSLMLSANPRNLQGGAMIEDCSGEGDKHLKNTSEYFADFHFYLREALHTQEYK